ncbi:hypothetical protein ACSYAD_23035 [Acaryochloris marina NIES-2412]|uniref:hypothetical protein n=1 Tax=Acaryochloris marina TaxID=155978 RepID=UPI004059CE3D
MPKQLIGLTNEEEFIVHFQNYIWIHAVKYSVSNLLSKKFSKEIFFTELLQHPIYVEETISDGHKREKFHGPYLLDSINSKDYKLVPWSKIKTELEKHWLVTDKYQSSIKDNLFCEIERDIPYCYLLNETCGCEELIWNYYKIFEEYIILSFEEKKLWILTIGKD